MIFTSCLETRFFSIYWKKANIVPTHKKEIKQLLENYRPVSLLSICDKIIERVIYNEMYPYLIDNNFISSYKQALKEVIFALTSSFQSSMKHINLLMKVLKSGEYF